MTEPIEPPAHLSHGLQEPAAIIVREENLTPLIASGGDVLQRPSEFDTKRSGHGLRCEVIPFSRQRLPPLERLCNGRPDPIPCVLKGWSNDWVWVAITAKSKTMLWPIV